MSINFYSVKVIILTYVLITALWYIIAKVFNSNELSNILSNLLFCIILLLYVYISTVPVVDFFRASIIGGCAIVLIGVASSLAGALLHDSYPVIGRILLQSLSLGYYPSGPDAPFLIGVSLWGLSMMALTVASVGVGLALRQRLR